MIRSTARISSLIAFALALAHTGCGPEPPPPPPPPEFTNWTLENLTADKGISIRIPEFEVDAGAEIQDCYFIQVPDIDNGNPIWIDRFYAAQNPGSHHMNVFRVKTIKMLKPEDGEDIALNDGLTAKVVRGGPAPTGQCWKSGNWSDWPLVTNTQNSDPKDPYTDWTLPAGVAAKFMPGEMLMVQTHYVNASTQKAQYKGRVGINFYKHAGTDAPQELGTFFSTQQSIRICRSNPTPTFTGGCSFVPTATVTITAINGHFHSRGKEFDVYKWDGRSTEAPVEADRIYQSKSWDDPPMDRGLSIPSAHGSGIKWSCTYQWAEPEIGCGPVDMRDPMMQNDCCYTFGPIVETSEHCNVFLYYYPKVENTDITCL